VLFNDQFSAWIEHYAFAFFSVEKLKPKVFVELGSHYGGSYFSFCQAIQSLGLECKSFAVDTWQGDEHAGHYSEEVYSYVKKNNDKHFSDFSTLIRQSFDEAADQFASKSIDLLHIDGLHTYEAVKHDFETWLPKMSESGVIIFHDTAVKERGFGVWKLMEELKNLYPYFEFEHGYGLGVLCIGNNINPDFLSFINEKESIFVKNLFAVIGKKNLLEYRLKHQELLAKQELTAKDHELVKAKQELTAKDHELVKAKQELTAKDHELERVKQELVALHLSWSWRMTRPLRKVKRFLARGIKNKK